ncbi:MAG: SLC13 family permease [Desulfobacterales bacterium]
MAEEKNVNGKNLKTRVLIIDDEDRFRESLSKQLTHRGFEVFDVSNGEDAIKIVRHENPEVVILDQKMPGMDGLQTLKELKQIRPEVQIIMHTGHGSIESARITGKHDVFSYLEKPCPLDELITAINNAAQERVYAMAKHEIPEVKKNNLKEWLIGVQNARPGFILLGIFLFISILIIPAPKLTALLSEKKAGNAVESINGFAEYRKMEIGQTITEYYGEKAKLTQKTTTADGKIVKTAPSVEQVVFRAKAMIGVLVVAALFWATGAVPIGITALLVGTIMYFFGVYPADMVAQAYAKDSVIFIFGVLALAAAISKTGLDRRIGILLLGTSSSITRFAFIFGPMLAVTASFLSEHALVAFIAPVLLLVYMSAIRSAGLKQDRHLLVFMLLTLTLCANLGGPGSPAAGGRNAVMLGILSDYGIQVSFGHWVKMGLPFVPVCTLAVAAYFIIVFRRKIKTKTVNIASEVKREAEKLGKMTPDEYKSAFIIVLVVFLWVTMSGKVGMGGPAILCLVLLNILGVLRWKDINGIHWDVVALYAAASAMGSGLASTGAALWLAGSFVDLLPDVLKSGDGLIMSASLITGILTNFMSDGATVAAVGPITVPMATLSQTSPIAVGLATAFSSSFAHLLIIGTPNNAICYAVAKDPETGEQLVTTKDFLIYGGAVWIISMVVLFLWVILGYWRWFGFNV